MDLVNYGIRERYNQLPRFGYKLYEMGNLIDWESFRPLFNNLYDNEYRERWKAIFSNKEE